MIQLRRRKKPQTVIRKIKKKERKRNGRSGVSLSLRRIKRNLAKTQKRMEKLKK